MYSTANLSDVELKEQGNRLFSAKKFEDAIGCYTKAIVSEKESNFFFHRKTKRFDCKPHSSRCHYNACVCLQFRKFS